MPNPYKLSFPIHGYYDKIAEPGNIAPADPNQPLPASVDEVALQKEFALRKPKLEIGGLFFDPRTQQDVQIIKAGMRQNVPIYLIRTKHGDVVRNQDEFDEAQGV